MIRVLVGLESMGIFGNAESERNWTDQIGENGRLWTMFWAKDGPVEIFRAVGFFYFRTNHF